jgi:RNA polymerase sigma factor (TIGR02999 family)
MDSAVQEAFRDDVTELLLEWRTGSESAFERLVPHVMPELRRLAACYMRGERTGHTLQTTALVNEAWVRILQQSGGWDNRVHFFAVAARMMRHILVDHARCRASGKRGGDVRPIAFDDALAISEARSEYLLLLDEAMKKLARLDDRKSRVVELRFFGGMNVEETAQVLGVAPNTVIRDWRLAKAWLRREIESG